MLEGGRVFVLVKVQGEIIFHLLHNDNYTIMFIDIFSKFLPKWLRKVYCKLNH